jgi:hypothetical protein
LVSFSYSRNTKEETCLTFTTAVVAGLGPVYLSRGQAVGSSVVEATAVEALDALGLAAGVAVGVWLSLNAVWVLTAVGGDVAW